MRTRPREDSAALATILCTRGFGFAETFQALQDLGSWGESRKLLWLVDAEINTVRVKFEWSTGDSGLCAQRELNVVHCQRFRSLVPFGHESMRRFWFPFWFRF